MAEPVRNPADVLAALGAACAAHPTQRVTQVIVNVLGEDPFYIEDEVAAQWLRDYAALGLRTVNQPASPRIQAKSEED